MHRDDTASSRQIFLVSSRDSASERASGKPTLSCSHTTPPGRAEGLFLILDSDRLIVPTRKTLSPKLDRGALSDLLLSHTLSSSMSTSFLVVDVTLRRSLSRRIRSSIKNDTKSLRERFGPEMFTEREGGREGGRSRGRNHRRWPPPPEAVVSC